MSVTEVGVPLDSESSQVSEWGKLVAEYGQDPEYQHLLDMVPLWGQELLMRLRDHHQDSFKHSLRVAATVDIVLNGWPISGISSESVILAAILHDAKKDIVPLTHLDKNGPLTEKERDEVKPHAIEVYSAIRPYNHLVAQLAGGHHLHQLDPYGHEGARKVPWHIAAGQRLIAAADVADALGSERSYKQAMSPHEVRAIMIDGGHFQKNLIDRVLVARFLQLPFFSPVHSANTLSASPLPARG